jgi:hypothetical protein
LPMSPLDLLILPPLTRYFKVGKIIKIVTFSMASWKDGAR